MVQTLERLDSSKLEALRHAQHTLGARRCKGREKELVGVDHELERDGVEQQLAHVDGKREVVGALDEHAERDDEANRRDGNAHDEPAVRELAEVVAAPMVLLNDGAVAERDRRRELVRVDGGVDLVLDGHEPRDEGHAAHHDALGAVVAQVLVHRAEGVGDLRRDREDASVADAVREWLLCERVVVLHGVRVDAPPVAVLGDEVVRVGGLRQVGGAQDPDEEALADDVEDEEEEEEGGGEAAHWLGENEDGDAPHRLVHDDLLGRLDLHLNAVGRHLEQLPVKVDQRVLVFRPRVGQVVGVARLEPAAAEEKTGESTQGIAQGLHHLVEHTVIAVFVGDFHAGRHGRGLRC